MTESASAFVPGHVTTFFSVHRRRTPAETGSRGGGITLTNGVTVRIEPADELKISLNGTELSMDPVTRLLSELGVIASVEANSPLPLGAGFGVSGAATLGTALAANQAFSLGYSENELIELAHVSEVESGTGLGDVVAQARGGVPLRLEPGSPSNGKLDGIPATGRIEWHSFGDLSTEAIISGDIDQLSTAGEAALAAVRKQPTLPTLFEVGRRFAREADLLVPEVTEAIETVHTTGGEAMMAMLGRTVVALDTGLSDAGYDPAHCWIHPGGATLRSDDIHTRT